MEKINRLKDIFIKHNLEGYLVPKNDEFFNEYVPDHEDDLKFISNFSGSYGLALILKKKIIYLSMEDTRCKRMNKVEKLLKSLRFLF